MSLLSSYWISTELFMSLCHCRWERSGRTLQSGRLTSLQSLKKLADGLALKSTTSSSVLRQSNANCLQSWDLARPPSSLCPRELCPSISTTNGTGTRRRLGCTARHPQMALWPWMERTQREARFQLLNTSNRRRSVSTFEDPFKVFLLIMTGGLKASLDKIMEVAPAGDIFIHLQGHKRSQSLA